MTASIRDISVRRLDGTPASLGDFDSKVLLIVNVASKCGLTPQYDGLEKLYEEYRDRGFSVLGFPCNQFAGQEPGSAAEIEEFCRLTYGVAFPLFEKIDVKGPRQHPLYALLTAAQPVRRTGTVQPKVDPAANPADVRWNFEKFLVDRGGAVIGRFDPAVLPEDAMIVSMIETELARGAA
jgi:glutathione peroxidase